ncbi:MAG: hypothetical protein ACJAZ0_001641 [Halioglobus sp.]|jgi:hypothetical protein
MATEILLSSKGTTVPFRFITRICPGAVAAILALTLGFASGAGEGAAVDVPRFVSVCMVVRYSGVVACGLIVLFYTCCIAKKLLISVSAKRLIGTSMNWN